jgi:TonB family protein
VRSAPFVRRLAVALALWVAFRPSLAAQNVLLTEHGGQILVVRGASGLRPVVELEGKRTVSSGYRLGLRPVEEFLPVFVSVRNVQVTTSFITVADSGGEINNELHFRASFESTFLLDNVFVVLDLRGERAGHMFFLYEIGSLEPREPKPVEISVPLAFAFGSGQYYYHVFVDGMEALHSGIPVEQREAALDHMIAKRIGAVQDGHLKVFVGPPPEYPKSLRKANVAGRATVSVRVTATGRPVDITLKNATDPAFGEAAVAAVRLWRFLPVVRNGRPVETLANIPFAFTPPVKGGK